MAIINITQILINSIKRSATSLLIFDFDNLFQIGDKSEIEKITNNNEAEQVDHSVIEIGVCAETTRLHRYYIIYCGGQTFVLETANILCTLIKLDVGVPALLLQRHADVRARIGAILRASGLALKTDLA